MMKDAPLVTIRNLTIAVSGPLKKRIVDSVDLKINRLGINALVGGSGSGKTTTAFSILRLLDPALNIEKGEITFAGRNLLRLPEDEIRAVRGAKIGMIFQEPLNAFNPVFTIGFQIEEVLRYHTDLSISDRQKKMLEIIDLVGLPDPLRIIKSYPHQLSGGMRQRAMIAQAICCEPQLIIADEPTSNLDVTLQARIMQLFKTLRDELKITFLLITHDLPMVGHVADYVNVMKEGKLIESGKSEDILAHPSHVYTKELLKAMSR